MSSRENGLELSYALAYFCLKGFLAHVLVSDLELYTYWRKILNIKLVNDFFFNLTVLNIFYSTFSKLPFTTASIYCFDIIFNSRQNLKEMLRYLSVKYGLIVSILRGRRLICDPFLFPFGY